jgi:hypothetical protein
MAAYYYRNNNKLTLRLTASDPIRTLCILILTLLRNKFWSLNSSF